MNAKPAFMSVLKWVAIVVAVVVFVFSLLLWFTTGTQVGARMVLGFVERSSLGIRIEEVRGKLAGPLFLSGIHVQHDLAEVSVERVTLDWKLFSMPRRRLHIDSLRVSGIDALVTLPTQTEQQSVAVDSGPAVESTPFEPPVDVVFDLVGIERISANVPDLVTASVPYIGLSGTLDTFALSAEATLVGEKVPDTRITISATGNTEEIRVDSLNAEILEGLVAASGVARWFPEIAWDLALRVDTVAPGLLATDSTLFSGVVSLAAETEGQLSERGPLGSFVLDTLYGSLRNQPIGGSAFAEIDADSYAISDIDLRWGRASILGWANIGDVVDADLDVEAPDLAALHPDAAGAFSAELRVVGPLRTPQIDGSYEGSDIAFLERTLRHLDGTLHLDLAGEREFDLTLRAVDITADKTLIDSIVAAGSGTFEDHGLELQIASSYGDLGTSLAGGLRNRTWVGAVADLEVGSNFGTWALEERTDVRVARTGGDVGALCLRSSDGRVCMSGNWLGNGSAQLSATTESLTLASFDSLLPPGMSVTGAVSAALDLGVSADRAMAVDLSATLADGELRYAMDDQNAIMQHREGRLTAYVDSSGTHAQLSVALLMEGASVAEADGNVSLPTYNNLNQVLSEQAVSANLSASVVTLSPFTSFVPRVDSLDGNLELNASVAGTIGEPMPEWVMAFDSGLVSVPELGLRVDGISARAEGDSLDGLSAVAKARSGLGEVELLIESPFKPTAESPATIEVRGDRFQAVNTPTTEVVISPDLSMVYTGDSVALTGEVDVPIGIVELTQIPELAVPISPDVVIVGTDTADTEPLLALSADVSVQFGDSVSFSGFGLNSWLSGGLNAVQSPGDAPLASGEIVVDSGFYRAYGQDLTVERGRVAFTGGPVDNPGLDIRAIRTADDGTVAGVQIRGPLQNPEFSVFSEPAMAQADALSYIVLGRRYDDASGSDQDVVRNAATSLGLQGGSALAGSVGRRVGLDETRLETESGALEDASLVAGKYLSPRLFVAYGIGLFDVANALRVRYLLSRLLTVQAETGAATSSDVLFRIEVGGERQE